MSRFITNLNHDRDHSFTIRFFLLCRSMASRMVVTAGQPTVLVLLFVLEVNSDFVFDDRLDFRGLRIDCVVRVVHDSNRNLQDLLQAQENLGLDDLDQVPEAEHQQEDFVVAEVPSEKPLL